MFYKKNFKKFIKHIVSLIFILYFYNIKNIVLKTNLYVFF